MHKRSGRGCEIEELSGVVEIEGELVEGDGTIALISHSFSPHKIRVGDKFYGKKFVPQGHPKRT